MSIRVIEEAEIKCDNCGKRIADMRLSKQLLHTFIEEEGFLTITCIDCKNAETPLPDNFQK